MSHIFGYLRQGFVQLIEQDKQLKVVAQAEDGSEAMDLIKTRRRVADPDIFYIKRRILRFARQWESV